MAGKVPERYPVVPMEDTVQALMDHLVAPLLPARVSSRATAEEQQSVAKQMHAVVLLYNYYHRKQFPELEFLDFRSFCKVATIAKPPIFGFMKFMAKNGENPQDIDSEISITERKIMDACNISVELDASKNAPNMEGWPVSWVAVFLVDDKKEKCYLEFGPSTLGIWSLLEKEVDEPTSNLVNNINIKQCAFESKTSHEFPDESMVKDDSAQRIAFSLVEQKTGICCSKLHILERNVTYSLNKEKTSTMLYIMKSVEAVLGLMEFAIEDVLSRLAGPLINTGSSPEVTSVVEYYHLLPYVNGLSDWLSRVAPRDASLDLQRHLTDSHDRGINECDFVKQTLVISSNNINKSANKFVGKNGSNLSSSQDSSRENSIPQANAVTFSAELDLSKSKDGITYYNNNNTNERNKSRNESLLAISETHKLGNNSSSDQFQQPSSSEDDVQKNAISSNTYVNKRSSSDKTRFDCLAEGQQAVYHGSVFDSENDAGTLQEFDLPIGLEEDEPDLAKKPRSVQINGGETFFRDASQNFQNAESSLSLPLVPIPLASEIYNQSSLVMASKKHEFLQASLQILQKRRDDLVQQRRCLDDEIAECEMNMQEMLTGQTTMISSVESMIRACNALCSSQMQLHSSYSGFGNQVQEIKAKRLSEAILIPKSSCQELDDICRQNGWTLPRYNLFPSTAGRSYQASVIVMGIDFETTVRGALQSRPEAARLSAATAMLCRLRSMVDQHQTLG